MNFFIYILLVVNEHVLLKITINYPEAFNNDQDEDSDKLSHSITDRVALQCKA